MNGFRSIPPAIAHYDPPVAVRIVCALHADDLQTNAKQLALPTSPMFMGRTTRARAFDLHPGLGGWRPRPPPTQQEPAPRAAKPREQQVKGDNTYRAMVRRANISQHNHKSGAWARLARKAYKSAHVLILWPTWRFCSLGLWWNGKI